MNKKGDVRDVILLLVTLFSMGIIFFVCYFAFTNISTKLIANPIINSSNYTVSALNSVEDTGNRLDWVIFAVFIGFSLAIIITGWFIGGYPIFMFLYFLMLMVTIICGMIFSNVWEELAGAGIFQTGGVLTITHFPITNHLITYSPIYIAIIGFLAMVAMFVKPYFGGSGGGADY